MDFNIGMDLVTSRLRLKDINPGLAKSIAQQYNLKEDEVQFIRKGITPTDLQFEDGERAVISYITTGAKDRDREIVDPKGAILDDYRKNPVVLFCHDYRQLPIGKNIWIKSDDKGLIAKTVYATHEEAEKVYQYRKEGFPLAESIGFVPIAWEDYNSDEMSRNNGVRRTFKKWILLEYSDVPVPSNPEALMVAVSKGLVKTKVEPVEVRETMVKQVDWICPYCKEAIREKSLYNDGIYDYHRPCTDKGAILLPKQDTGLSEEKTKDANAGKEQKTADTEGNPSVWDIADAIQNHMNPDYKSKKWLMDLYPTKYPNGHVVIRDDKKLLMYAYEYGNESAKLIGDPTEIKDEYKPKDIFEFIFKEGRVLSSKNRDLISRCIEEMKTSITALEQLLAATETAPGTEEESFDLDDIDAEPDEDILADLKLDDPSDDNGDIDLSAFDFTEEKDPDENKDEIKLDSEVIDSVLKSALDGYKPIDVKSIFDDTMKKLKGKVV